jgi:CspA family cold shock protein
MTIGTVKWFSERKGFGFIEQEEGEDEIVRHSAINTDGLNSSMKRAEFPLI